MSVLSFLQNFDNSLGALLFLGLIPFILLYLIKPKPSERVIPSLMFLVRQMQQTKSTSFFKHFMRDILVLIHILILLVMSFAAMHPFYETNAAAAAEYTVLILDTSASMSTKSGVSNRLGEMKDTAKDYLDGKISIILSQNTPYVVLRDGDKGDALDIINSIKETDMLTALGSSILAADDLLQDKKGRVIVISDFVNTDPLSPSIAKESLEAKGHVVEFVSVQEPAENVGIVAMESSDNETRVTIQNYEDKTVYIPVRINNQKYPIEIGPYWQEKLSFAHQEGLNTIELDYPDNFALDNSVVLSVPQRKKATILVITNAEKSFVYPVLQAYAEFWNEDASIEKGEPPVMPVVDHDIIVLSDVSVSQLPSSVIKKIQEEVEAGSALIVTAQEDLTKLDVEDLLPVTFSSNDVTQRKTDVVMENVLTAVTTGVSIPGIEKYLQATPKKSATVVASTTEGVPLLVLGGYGKGTVVYYGLFEANSTFKYDVTYPIFWQQLVDYLIGKDTLDTINYKIGEKVLFDNKVSILTPSGKERTEDSLEFEEGGIYEYLNKKVAVNLLNSVESNVAYNNEAIEKSITEEQEAMPINQPLTKPFIIALLVILFLELLYVKLRGDF